MTECLLFTPLRKMLPVSSRPPCGHCTFPWAWQKADMQKIERDPEVAINSIIPTVLLLAFLLHNLEEALTFGAFRQAAETLLRKLTSSEFSTPSYHSFLSALVVVSLIAALAMAWAILQPSRRSALVLVQGLAWIMLINVFVPHVPAAILLGGYAPGLITAVFVNLPIAGFALVRLESIAQQKQTVTKLPQYPPSNPFP